MNGGQHRRLSFAILDREKGVPELPPATGEEYPLPAWYRAIRETPLEELTVEDIAKACRQQIHVEHVVPIALRLLQSEPLAGEMYDGELLVSIKSVPTDFWSAHKTEAAALKSICDELSKREGLSADLLQDVAELLTKARLA